MDVIFALCFGLTPVPFRAFAISIVVLFLLSDQLQPALHGDIVYPLSRLVLACGVFFICKGIRMLMTKAYERWAPHLLEAD